MYNLKKNDWMIVPEPSMIPISSLMIATRKCQTEGTYLCTITRTTTLKHNGLKAKWFWLPQSMDDTTWIAIVDLYRIL